MKTEDLINEAYAELQGSYGCESAENKQISVLRSLAKSQLAILNMMNGSNCEGECNCKKSNEIEEEHITKYNDYIIKLVKEIEKNYLQNKKIKEVYDMLDDKEKEEIDNNVFNIIYYGLLPE